MPNWTQLVAERPARTAQADIIRLLYCTGCRCSEIRTLRWCEVGTATLDLEDSKTGPRKVYLNSEARRIIERQPRTGSDYVFPSSSDPTLPVSESMQLWFTLRSGPASMMFVSMICVTTMPRKLF